MVGGGESENYHCQEEADGLWVLGKVVGRRLSVLVLKHAPSEMSSNSNSVWCGVGRWLCPWCWYVSLIKQKGFFHYGQKH